MGTLIQTANGNALAFAASYVALLALLSIALAYNVIRGRYKFQVGLGDGGEKELNRRIRAHGNYSEYAPLIIGLLILLPLLGAKEWMVHLVGLTGLVGRIAHAIGLSGSAGPSIGRAAGMMLTFASIVSGALLLLFLAWH